MNTYFARLFDTFHLRVGGLCDADARSHFGLREIEVLAPCGQRRHATFVREVDDLVRNRSLREAAANASELFIGHDDEGRLAVGADDDLKLS